MEVEEGRIKFWKLNSEESFLGGRKESPDDLESEEKVDSREKWKVEGLLVQTTNLS